MYEIYSLKSLLNIYSGYIRNNKLKEGKIELGKKNQQLINIVIGEIRITF